MKKLVIVSALLLGGCSSMERPQLGIIHHSKPKVEAEPPAAVTPNDQVKKRWTDKFKHHPKFFH
ncbi:hypothetical protein [Bradyrhizobium sp.]|uniref:hypothetical protein n=1 Tax=Bradyrhizobium sp. TaxID=376 RepID=UPI002D744B0F|nr:hypothetical protein [Bradyrhizobium sp.]HZR77349.1 hypothetical protein [Bradyrhizobium sp.]